MEILKAIVVGPPVSGKTSLINTFMSGHYQGYIPTNVLTRYDVNFVLKVSDTGDKVKSYYFKIYDYDMFKPNEQQFLKEDELVKIDVIILCFKDNLTTRELIITAFRNVLNERWPNVPIMLVSSFSDLVHKYNCINEPFEPNEGNMQPKNHIIMNELGASSHLHCSSLENANIETVFAEAFKLAVNHHNQTIKNSKDELFNKNQSNISIPSKKNEIEQEKNTNDNVKSISKSFEEKNQRTTSKDTQSDFVMQKQRNTPKIYISSESQFQKSDVKNSFEVIVKESETRIRAKLIFTFVFVFVLLFIILSKRYCSLNRQECNEIYDLSAEIFEDTLAQFQDLCRSCVDQFKKLSIRH